jgi:Flp pilus assembly protein TadG
MNDSRMNARALLRTPQRRCGQSAVELALLTPVLMALLLIAADLGRVFYFAIVVDSAARAGAQYGSQSVITAADSAGIKAAAKTDANNISGLSVTASQCTCESSTTVTACASSYCTNSSSATYVLVNTQMTFHTVVTYPGIPSSISLSGEAIMQVQG